jgi:DNA (cytosine-5)-methyltransferase 1
MNVLSLFSGVGGFDLGLENAGMKTIYQCEWDKHANSILERHWPQVPRWGDISTLTAKEILRHGTPPDVVAWGSPCQDLSVAGKRAGLVGERSGLFHEGIRIINELRKETNNEYPKISIWENVAGALSSNRGADFGVILDEMAKAGAMVIEWGLLDAQHFGIPQRRRRVFCIAIFNSATASNCPNPLLPVGESLPRNTAKGKPKRQSVASETSESLGTGGFRMRGFGDYANDNTASAIKQRDYKDATDLVVSESSTSSSFAQYQEGVGTLRSNGGDLGGASETLIAEPMLSFDTQFGSNANVFEDQSPTLKASQAAPSVAYPIDTRNALRDPDKYDAQNRQGLGIGNDGDPMATLTSAHVNAVAFSHYDSQVSVGEVSPTLRSGTNGTGHAVAYDEYNDSINETHHALRAGTKQSTGVLLEGEVVGTLRSGGSGGVPSSRGEHLVTEPTMAVRRLTPLECERLMGWPDDHTRYKADGTEQADTHRYKQCGNGVASPVAEWIGKQLMKLETSLEG